MVTFLVSNDFAQCARILDPARLSRQIGECPIVAKLLMAYGAIRDERGKLPWGIIFPPVIKLWVAPSGLLLINELYEYYLALNQEWERHHDEVHKTNFNWVRVLGEYRPTLSLEWPQAVHQSHRSKLLEKEFSYYERNFNREHLEHNGTGHRYVWQGPIVIGP